MAPTCQFLVGFICPDNHIHLSIRYVYQYVIQVSRILFWSDEEEFQVRNSSDAMMPLFLCPRMRFIPFNFRSNTLASS